jgi:hypothetical protein
LHHRGVRRAIFPGSATLADHRAGARQDGVAPTWFDGVLCVRDAARWARGPPNGGRLAAVELSDLSNLSRLPTQ